jgi:hypothetical protein
MAAPASTIDGSDSPPALAPAPEPAPAMDPDPPPGSVSPLDGCTTVEPDEPPEDTPVPPAPDPTDNIDPLAWLDPAVPVAPPDVDELEAPVGEPQAARTTMGATDPSSLRTTMAAKFTFAKHRGRMPLVLSKLTRKLHPGGNGSAQWRHALRPLRLVRSSVQASAQGVVVADVEAIGCSFGLDG